MLSSNRDLNKVLTENNGMEQCNWAMTDGKLLANSLHNQTCKGFVWGLRGHFETPDGLLLDCD